MAKSLGSGGKARPNSGQSSSSAKNVKAQAGQRKAAPARSNAGGAVRGQARAAQVKGMNAARKSPISIVRNGKKTSITGSRSVAAQAIRRGKAASAAAPKAAGVGAPKGFDSSGIRNAIGESNPVDKLFKSIGSRLSNPRGK